MKFLTLALCAGACASAFGRTDNVMPEGTSDSYFGVSLASVPLRQGDSRQRTVMLPFLSKQYSNGVFLAPGALGVQMSGQPGLEYGPTLTYGFAQRPGAADDTLRLTTEVGGFVSYQPIRGLRLSSTALYGGGDGHDGMRLSAGASFTMPLASHQSVSLKAGLSVASQSYLQSYYGTPGYRPAAGLRDASVGGNWNWQLNKRYALATGVGVSRLLGSAADSPVVRQLNNANAYTSLSYHY